MHAVTASVAEKLASGAAQPHPANVKGMLSGAQSMLALLLTASASNRCLRLSETLALIRGESFPDMSERSDGELLNPAAWAAQVWAGVVPVGPTGVGLCSNYQSRDSPAYKTDLGLALAAWARIVPDGMLVFFPSYVVMTACIAHWKSASAGGADRVLDFAGTLWDRITGSKQAVIEPKARPLLLFQVAQQCHASHPQCHPSACLVILGRRLQEQKESSEMLSSGLSSPWVANSM